jgi:hypothetical protein
VLAAHIQTMWRHLHCRFSLPVDHTPQWHDFAYYDRASELDSYEAVFKLEHAHTLHEMEQLNQSSWYMDVAKRKRYAEEFVRDLQDGSQLGETHPTRPRATTVTYRLNEQSMAALVPLLHAPPTAVAVRQQLAQAMADLEASLTKLEQMRDQMAIFPPASNAASQQDAVSRIYQPTSGLVQMQAAFKGMQQQWTDQAVEQMFAQMVPSGNFSRYGPSLYTENHPPAVRQAWHCALLDESLTAGGLQPMPTVLTCVFHQRLFGFRPRLDSGRWVGRPHG